MTATFTLLSTVRNAAGTLGTQTTLQRKSYSECIDHSGSEKVSTCKCFDGFVQNERSAFVPIRGALDSEGPVLPCDGTT